MNFHSTITRRRLAIPLVGAVLAAFYLLGFKPLETRSRELDVPLRRSWQSLAAALGQTNATVLNFGQITNQLAETRKELALLEAARKKAALRVEWDPAIRLKMEAPFELYEYQNERSKQADELARLGKEQKVVVEPAVLTGFPEHTADIKEPVLLWPALSMVQYLLTTAVKCKVGIIHSLDVPLTLTNQPAGGNRLAEIMIQTEMTGSLPNVMRLVQSLPLRSADVAAAGLPSAGTNKPPLFVDRIIVRKQTPEQPDEVRLALRLVGFVLRE